MTSVIGLFLSPNTIFFLPYLFSAIVITLLWLKVVQNKNFKDGLDLLFKINIWWNRQTLTDFLCSLLILLGITKMIEPVEDFIYDYVGRFETFLEQKPFISFQLHPAAESLLATIIAMLAYDFASYFMHRGMHKNNLLWKVHSFHHSAKNLTFFTTYRQNPLEPILLASVRSFAAAISVAIFHYFFRSQNPVYTFYGLGAGFFIYMFTVNLHHSPIPVSYPAWMRKILISPHVHHLHHSCAEEHQEKNFGVVFSIWDRWFKTYHDEEVGLKQLTFSIDS